MYELNFFNYKKGAFYRRRLAPVSAERQTEETALMAAAPAAARVIGRRLRYF